MRLNMDSPAQTAITQVFDVIGMGGGTDLPQHLRAFNLPGTSGPENWATRIPAAALGKGRGGFVDALASMAKLSRRA